VRAARTELGGIVSAGLLVTVLTAIGALLFIVPGVYLVFSWFVVMPVVVLEGAGGRAALRRARSLTRGSWWQILGAYLIVEAFVLLCSIPIEYVVGAASGGSIVGQQVATYLLQLLLSPLTVSLVTVVYFDLRARREGITQGDVAAGAGAPGSAAADFLGPWERLSFL